MQQYRPFVYMFSDFALMKLLNLLTCGQCLSCCRCACLVRRRARYDRFQLARDRLARELDLLELVKRQRVFGLLTQALFAQRQAVFVGYADQFNIAVNVEEAQPEKATDALGVDELTEILQDFDPVSNAKDRNLVNFLAGRELPEDELSALFADVGTS